MPMPRNDHTVSVTTKENGNSVNLHPGDLLEVTLPATLGTGFSWRVRSGAEAVLRLKGKPVVKKPQDANNQVGAAEYQVFQFEVIASGSVKLELEYVRPWERDVAPAKTYLLTILVN